MRDIAEALELVSQQHEIVDAPGAEPLTVREGAIRFERIRFSHPDGQVSERAGRPRPEGVRRAPRG